MQRVDEHAAGRMADIGDDFDRLRERFHLGDHQELEHRAHAGRFGARAQRRELVFRVGRGSGSR